MTWFLCAWRISLGFGVGTEIELFFVWGLELTRCFYGNPIWLSFVIVSKLTWFI